MTTPLAPVVEPSSSRVCDFANRTLHELRYSIGKRRENASTDDLFRAVAQAARQTLVDGLIATEERLERRNPKRIYYISIEYLIGRLLRSTLSNLGLLEVAREAAKHLEFDLDEIMDVEPDAALGNGGLGRLAACFLETMASLGMPAMGFGINYEYGLFQQDIEGGAQRERADHWLRRGTPWQLTRRDQGDILVQRAQEALGVRGAQDDAGHQLALWHIGEHVDEVQGELVAVVVDHGQVGVHADQLFLVGFDLHLHLLRLRVVSHRVLRDVNLHYNIARCVLRSGPRRAGRARQPLRPACN